MIKGLFITLLLYSSISIAFDSRQLHKTSDSKVTSDSSPELKYLYARLLLENFKLRDAQK